MNSDLEDIGVNPSSNPTFQSVLEARLGRRDVLRGSLHPAVLRHGAVLREPKYAHWFGKPEGVQYKDLLAQLAPVVDRAHGALWMRQMVLGPAREFCLHATAPVSVPAEFGALVLPPRSAWPDVVVFRAGPRAGRAYRATGRSSRFPHSAHERS
jgi:hypothetical protein